jgi:hypothetical protein
MVAVKEPRMTLGNQREPQINTKRKNETADDADGEGACDIPARAASHRQCGLAPSVLFVPSVPAVPFMATPWIPPTGRDISGGLTRRRGEHGEGKD